MSGTQMFPELWFYARLSRLPFPKGYVGKLLAICFVGTHIPLIALIIFALAEMNLSEPKVQASLFVVLIATIFGTVTALFALHAMIAPVNMARVALINYREHRRLPHLPRDYQDAAGVLLREVDATIHRLDDALAEISHEARTDPLTGTGNRRVLMEEGKRLVQEARRKGEALALAIIDLDGFKAVNDSQGHSAGDQMLTLAAAAMRSKVGNAGLICRLGGDEFCILLPGLAVADSVKVLERVRLAIAATHLDNVPPSTITASIGVAELVRPGEDGLPQMLSRADAQVYRAKDMGRNQVAFAT